MLTGFLKICKNASQGSTLKDAGPELPIQLTLVLIQLFAIPGSAVNVECGEGDDELGSTQNVPSAQTAAEAVDAIQNKDLTWDHLTESSISAAGVMFPFFLSGMHIHAEESMLG